MSTVGWQWISSITFGLNYTWNRTIPLKKFNFNWTKCHQKINLQQNSVCYVSLWKFCCDQFEICKQCYIRHFRNKWGVLEKQTFLHNDEKCCVVMKIRTILIGPDLYHNRRFLIIRQKSMLLLRCPIYSGNVYSHYKWEVNAYTTFFLFRGTSADENTCTPHWLERAVIPKGYSIWKGSGEGVWRRLSGPPRGDFLSDREKPPTQNFKNEYKAREQVWNALTN